jgi:hypothetical protein
MIGIKLSHGVIFVNDGLITVRVLPSGEVGVSPVTFQTLEWQLKNEPLDSYDYLTEGEIESLKDYDKILLEFKRVKDILKI